MTIKPTKPEAIFHTVSFAIMCLLAGGISFFGAFAYVSGFVLYKMFVKPQLAVGAGTFLKKLLPPRQ